jgi:branched-chain amino acid transport system ATP-binding protein
MSDVTDLRRPLVPTSREQELGVEMADYDYVDAGPPPPPKISVGDAIRSWAKTADPRSIDGPLRPLVIISIVGFIASWDAAAFGILLPDIQSEFGLNVGFLIGLGNLMAIIGLVVAVPFGYLADRVSRVRMLQIGALFGGGSAIAQGLAKDVSGLAAARVVGGVGGAVGEPAGLPLFTDYYPSHSRARVFAFMAATGAVGALIGPVIAGRAANALGWRGAIVLLSVLATVAGLLTFLLKEPKRGYLDRLEAGATEEQAQQEQKPMSFGESARAAYSIVTLRRLWYAAPFLYVGGAGLSVLMALYFAQVFQLDAGQRGTIASLGAAAGLLGLILSGPVADRVLAVRPGRLITMLGLIVLGQCVVLLVFTASPWLWLSVGITLPLGFVSALLAPATITVTSLVIPARVRGMGLQMSAPFALIGILGLQIMTPYFNRVGVRQGFLLVVPFLAIGGLIILSAASGVERDIRAARAAAMADQEAARARASGRSKMLICRDVDVDYDGVQVLFNVDFDVEEGDIIALLGTNGAGKSTLLRAIAGIREAANGAIFLDGVDITHVPPHENAANGIVMMPGGNAVFPTLTVAENLRTAGWMYREDEDYLAQRTDEVLAFFPVLRDRLDQPAGNLSGGEQQMVGLGQAFLMKPRLLMIDELSLGLAPAIVEQLLDILRRIHQQGTTIILVEQSLNVALTIAERCVFMEKGEIRFEGTTEELMGRPDLVRAVFMGGGTSARTSTRATAGAGEHHDVLRATDVALSFGGVRALTGASLDVRAGEIVGIIGPNGAGKTTLFDVISGFLTPDTGTVLVGDVDVAGLDPDARARLGLNRSFQNARLFPSLTVRENISVALERRATKNPIQALLWTPGQRKAEDRLRRRVDGFVELLGLGAYADKFVGELSTGTRRAVDVACVMAAEPTVLLLDEPSSGLAQAETEELGPVLTRIVRETGCGMLVIEHDLRLITSVSHRLVAMELGATIAIGTPDEVVNDPRVLASYLAASDDVISRSGSRIAALTAVLAADPDHQETRT